MKKPEVIDKILELVDTKWIENFMISTKANRLAAARGVECSTGEFNFLRKHYKVRGIDISYGIADRYTTTEKEEDFRDDIANSVRPNIYKTIKGERKPQPLFVQGLIKAAQKKSFEYQNVYDLRNMLKMRKTVALVNLLAELGCEVEDFKKIKKLLSELPCDVLINIKKVFEGNAWQWYDEGNYQNDDEGDVQSDLETMDYSNLVFLSKNYDVLMEYYDDIILIVQKLWWLDDNKANEANNRLNKKRQTSRYRYDYNKLYNLTFENVPLDLNIKNDIIFEVEQKVNTPEGATLISAWRKMNPDKWELLKLLLMHYGHYPKGKRMIDELNKLC